MWPAGCRSEARPQDVTTWSTDSLRPGRPAAEDIEKVNPLTPSLSLMNLTGQTAKADAIRPHLAAFRAEMEKRYEVWESMPPEKRRKWIQVAIAKDPLFDLFIGIVQYSRKWEINDDD